MQKFTVEVRGGEDLDDLTLISQRKLAAMQVKMRALVNSNGILRARAVAAKANWFTKQQNLK